MTTQLFGFAQFDFPGDFGLADGRYLARRGGEAGEQQVLVLETLSSAAAPGRRRRRPRPEDAASAPAVPVARATAVRASAPLGSEEEGRAWLDRVLASEQETDAVLEAGLALLNRALHAQAVASGDPLGRGLSLRAALVARIGFGTGDEVASGRFTAADRIDVQATGESRRRRRDQELRPQERVAAVLGERERPDACETLLLRARADLDGGREREAALQLRVALEALLVELDGALSDPGHAEDMAALRDLRKSTGEAANAALQRDLAAAEAKTVAETVAIAERVLRRRRVLRGG